MCMKFVYPKIKMQKLDWKTVFVFLEWIEEGSIFIMQDFCWEISGFGVECIRNSEQWFGWGLRDNGGDKIWRGYACAAKKMVVWMIFRTEQVLEDRRGVWCGWVVLVDEKNIKEYWYCNNTEKKYILDGGVEDNNFKRGIKDVDVLVHVWKR